MRLILILYVTSLVAQTSATAPTTAPDPPKKVTLRVAGENSLKVTIVPPDDNGGANVTQYRVVLTDAVPPSAVYDGAYWRWGETGASCSATCGNLRMLCDNTAILRANRRLIDGQSAPQMIFGTMLKWRT